MTRLRSSRGHHGDAKVEPQFELDNCLNCGQELLFVCSSENETSSNPGVVAFTSFVKNVKTQVFMKEALKEIYSVLNATEFEKDLEHCALCVDCSLVFAQLFGLFQTFESRRKSQGVLDVVVTKGIQRASELRTSTNGSAPGRETEETVDDFESEFEKFAEGPSDDENIYDDIDIDNEINEPADVITVQSIPSAAEEQIIDDGQQADFADDANWASDLDNDDPFTHVGPEDSNITETESASEMAKINDDANPTGNSSHELGEPSRKSRKIETQTKVETNMNSSEVEIKEETEESDYAPTSSNSDSDDSDTDKHNDGPSKSLPNRRKKSKGSISKSQGHVTFKCTDCPQEFHAAKTFAEHRKNSHSTSEIFKCHICCKSLQRGSHLTEHLLAHEKISEEDKILKCIDCGERYSSAAEIGRHRISVHGAIKNPYVCHICLYSCKYQTLLKSHVIRHIGIATHKCSECPNVYKLYTDLKSHMRRKHKITLRTHHTKPLVNPCDKVIVKCHKCQAQFESQEKFFEHTTTEHGDELFPCEICPQIFLRKDLLNYHLAKHGKPTLKCRFCEKEFRTSDGRRYHEQYKHQEDSTEPRQLVSDLPSQLPKTAGTFQCTKCPLTFDTETELSVHVSCRHKEDDYQFKCDACERSFLTNKRLRYHQEHFHGQVKCLKCDTIVKQGQMAAHLAKAHSRLSILQDYFDADNPTGNSSQELGEPSRKSRRIEAKTKVERNTDPADVDFNEEADEPNYAPNSNSDDSDTDEDNDGPSKSLPSRRKKPNGSRSYGRRNVTLKCPDCPEEFQTAKTFGEHRKNSHSTSEIFKCHICFKIYKFGSHLTGHLLQHEKSATKIVTDKDKIFKCIDCGERYSSAAEFGRHRINVHGALKNPYVCHICLVNVKNPTNLKPHIMRHISTEEHKCSECPRVFNHYANLQQHMRKKHKMTTRGNLSRAPGDPSIKVIIKCKKCGEKFESQENYLEHSTTEHGEELFPCKLCQNVFFRADLLADHLAKHAKSEICQFCNKKFATRTGLRYHEKHMHPEDSTESRQLVSDLPSQVPQAAGAFQCTKCPLAFDTEIELSVHVSCRHEEDDYEFKCDACERAFLTNQKLRYHQENFHGQVKCLKCDTIVKQGQMAAHLAQAHRRRKPKPSRVRRPPQKKVHNVPFPCIDCPEVLQTLAQFRKHRLTHNVSADAIYRCPICHGDRGPGVFREHLKKHHESTDWPCPHCTLRFLHRANRNEHQTRVHGPQPDDDPEGMLPLPPASTLQLLSGEKVHADVRHKGLVRAMIETSPFRCLECDQEFNRSLGLGNHRAIVHGCPVEKRFQCHTCRKFSPSASALHLHVQRHYGGRDHLCEVCGKGFRMSDDLKQHYRLNHTEDQQKKLREKWKNWRMKKAAQKRAEREGQE